MSHTTDDLIFIWLPEDKVPLAVDEGIQLPQLELVSNTTEDCTTVYTTGEIQWDKQGEQIPQTWNFLRTVDETEKSGGGIRVNGHFL